MEPDSMLPFEEESAVKEPVLPLPKGKTNFKPEELYRFTKIKPFVLRFWESEFPSLKPKKTDAQGLAYSRADVEKILAIKHLLYVEGLTIDGARRRLSGEEEAGPAATGKKAAKQKKKKVVPPAKAAETGETAVAAGKAKTPAKRGLPTEGASRSRVSLEELLPGNAAAATVVPPKKKRTATEKKRTPPPAASPAAENVSEALELRRRLSAVLQELRGILTFLHKGDR